MRNKLNGFEKILSAERLKKIFQHGAVYFDVDDTLLARRKNASEKDQIYSESAAAVLIPQLLKTGIKVCIITGHGWTQLEKRLVLPLIEAISNDFPENQDEILQRLSIYANRGATKLTLNNGNYAEDKNYTNKFILGESDLSCLSRIFTRLAEDFNEDFAKRSEFYRQNFSRFDFSDLPPKISEREKVILSLRPLPSASFSEDSAVESPRRKLLQLGYKLLKEQGLDEKYELSECGQSTLEFIRKTVTKKCAFQDSLVRIAEETNTSVETVAQSSLYIGDEFSEDGNDYIISHSFPQTLCISVAPAKTETTSANVIFASDYSDSEGVSATASIIAHILKFFDLNKMV